MGPQIPGRGWKGCWVLPTIILEESIRMGDAQRQMERVRLLLALLLASMHSMDTGTILVL